MHDASPEQASDDVSMALTIKEKSMNVFKDPSNFYLNNNNSCHYFYSGTGLQ